MRNLPNNSSNFPEPLRKVAAVAATIVVAGVALMFSAVMLAAILVVGTMGAGYLWWKTRELRKQMRNMAAQGVVIDREVVVEDEFKGEVIEGEVIHVVETHDGK